jgi:hypothetical protein
MRSNILGSGGLRIGGALKGTISGMEFRTKVRFKIRHFLESLPNFFGKASLMTFDPLGWSIVIQL